MVANSPTMCSHTGGCAFSRAHRGELHNDARADRTIGDFTALSAADSPTVLKPPNGWDVINACDQSDSENRQARSSLVGACSAHPRLQRARPRIVPPVESWPDRWSVKEVVRLQHKTTPHDLRDARKIVRRPRAILITRQVVDRSPIPDHNV